MVCMVVIAIAGALSDLLLRVLCRAVNAVR